MSHVLPMPATPDASAKRAGPVGGMPARSSINSRRPTKTSAGAVPVEASSDAVALARPADVDRAHARVLVDAGALGLDIGLEATHRAGRLDVADLGAFRDLGVVRVDACDRARRGGGGRDLRPRFSVEP